jgi:hypothetical protein
MKCIVKLTNEGTVVLHELLENEQFPMTYETLGIHRDIWKKNYLDKEIVELENFKIIEHEIQDEFFQLIALPVIPNAMVFNH